MTHVTSFHIGSWSRGIPASHMFILTNLWHAEFVHNYHDLSRLNISRWKTHVYWQYTCWPKWPLTMHILIVLYSIRYLLIQCAIGMMIPRRFDSSAAQYINNRNSLSVDWQPEWCGQLCNVSTFMSVGKWIFLGYCTGAVYVIQQIMCSLDEPFHRHAVNAQVLVGPVSVKCFYGAWRHQAIAWSDFTEITPYIIS